MPRWIALLFAVGGTVLLGAVGVCVSLKDLWLAVLSAVLSIGLIGWGFVIKAKYGRRKQISR
ncbi:DUF5325 family protein [Paenibacillus larvae]